MCWQCLHAGRTAPPPTPAARRRLVAAGDSHSPAAVTRMPSTRRAVQPRKRATELFEHMLIYLRTPRRCPAQQGPKRLRIPQATCPASADLAEVVALAVVRRGRVVPVLLAVEAAAARRRRVLAVHRCRTASGASGALRLCHPDTSVSHKKAQGMGLSGCTWSGCFRRHVRM